MFLVKLVMMMIRYWVSLFVKAVIVRTGNMSNSLRSNTERDTLVIVGLVPLYTPGTNNTGRSSTFSIDIQLKIVFLRLLWTFSVP